MAVKEQAGGLVFLRQVIPGGAERSFGVHVARLAGLPARVVDRAEGMLQQLEASRAEKTPGGTQVVLAEDRAVYDERAVAWRGVLRELMSADIANLTPLQALNLLNALQLKVKG